MPKRFMWIRADLAGEDGIWPRSGDWAWQYVVVKRYNRADPDTLPFMTALSREGQRIAVFSPYRRDVSDAEQRENRAIPAQHGRTDR